LFKYEEREVKEELFPVDETSIFEPFNLHGLPPDPEDEEKSSTNSSQKPSVWAADNRTTTAAAAAAATFAIVFVVVDCRGAKTVVCAYTLSLCK